MSDLRISRTLSLPVDAVTQTFAILAMRGRGKTYTGSVMVEEMIEQGLPVCVIDPTGAWWGLRSSADGKRAGYPVVIFGGKHADVPLTPTSGEMVADLLIERPFPCVIDLTAFDSKAEEVRFMTAFLTRLYRRNEQPLHLMIDEADEFAPQQAFPEGKRLLGAMEQIVRRGRIKGLGCTLITQRPAVLNKNVLSQTETLILLGMTGSNDLKAVDEWVGKHADSEEARSIKGTLPGLPPGTAWVWSPSWLGLTQQIEVRKRRTFDSSATPKVGQRIEARTMAEVDLAALRTQMAETIEQASAEDPTTLRQRIRTLERELATLTEKRPPERVEVPAFTDEERSLVESIGDRLADIENLLDGVTSEFTGLKEAASRVSPPPLLPMATTPSSPPPPRPAEIGSPASSPMGESLPKAQRAVLTVLAQHGTRTKTQVALLAGYSAGGGGFNNALGALRSAGHITGSGDLSITATGLGALGEVEPLPTGAALIEHHARNLTKAAREILHVLTEPRNRYGLSKEELAQATGYAATGGGFNNALGRLRSLELVTTTQGVTRAAEVLLY